MELKKIDVFMHPIRMKILHVLTQKDVVTTKEIAEICEGVPQATLYRHINKLVKEGIVEVVGQNRVRGTFEKVYKIKVNPIEEIEKIAQETDREKLINLFYNFTMTLLTDFLGYNSDGDTKLSKACVGFKSYPLYLTDEEVLELMGEIGVSILKRVNNKPTEERKLRKLSTILTPSNGMENISLRED